VSSPTERSVPESIEEALASDFPSDMIELSICSNFSSTANTEIAHHMNVEQQPEITSTSTLTADAGGDATEREEVDSEMWGTITAAPISDSIDDIYPQK
jgi:hypothetical protein